MIVDAHQHFWRLDRGDYGWLTPDLEVLYRDHLPGDLAKERQRAGISGTVVVQAAPTDAETDFLLGLAKEESMILAVVGWAALDAPRPEPRIEALAGQAALKSLRPMIQDMSDDNWMLSAAARRGFEAMADRGLRLDGLVRARQIGNLTKLVDRHPDLPMVLDHAGKPDIASGGFDGWAKDVAALAERPQVMCKLSGLLTEAGERTGDADLRPYVDHLLDSFGSDRLMWGSDWPVLNLAGSYAVWYGQARRLLAELSAHEQAAIFGEVATRFYGLEPRSL